MTYINNLKYKMKLRHHFVSVPQPYVGYDQNELRFDSEEKKLAESQNHDCCVKYILLEQPLTSRNNNV